MRPTSQQLARRDTALAAAMGIGDPVDFGSDYYGYASGDVDMGFGFGSDPTGSTAALAQASAAPSAAAAHHVANPMHPANVAKTRAVLAQHYAKGAKTSSRASMIHPNAGSDIDVERYDFSLNQAITLGTAVAVNMSIQPSVTVRPQRCVFNAPSLGFATISNILVANVSALIGSTTDAGIYGPQSFGIHLDLPTLTPANKLSIQGNYTGLTPPGFPAASPYLFVASFQCPATVVA